MHTIKRAIMLTTIGLLTTAAGAQASCGTGCLARKVSSLQKQVNADTRALRALGTCLAEAPVTRYGASDGTFGYTYNDGSDPAFQTTALDATAKGGSVDVWMLYDQCNTKKTATTLARVTEAGWRPSVRGDLHLWSSAGQLAPEFVIAASHRR